MRKQSRSRTLPRQSARETGEGLLAAGERLVNRYVREGPPRGAKPIDILAFVSMEDVLHEATEERRRDAIRRGAVPAAARVPTLTPGAFYRAFPPPSGRGGPRRKGEALAVYRRELGRRIVSAESYPPELATLGDILASLAGSTAESRARVAGRLAATKDLDSWRDSPTDLLFYALILHARDPEIGDWLRDLNDRALDYLEDFWRTWLPRYGRRCRKGVTERQLAAAMRATLAVMGLEGRIAGSPTNDRVTIDDPDPTLAGEWPLAVIAAEGVFFVLTERSGEPAVPVDVRRRDRRSAGRGGKAEPTSKRSSTVAPNSSIGARSASSSSRRAR